MHRIVRTVPVLLLQSAFPFPTRSPLVSPPPPPHTLFPPVPLSPNSLCSLGKPSFSQGIIIHAHVSYKSNNVLNNDIVKIGKHLSPTLFQSLWSRKDKESLRSQEKVVKAARHFSNSIKIRRIYKCTPTVRIGNTTNHPTNQTNWTGWIWKSPTNQTNWTGWIWKSPTNQTNWTGWI